MPRRRPLVYTVKGSEGGPTVLHRLALAATEEQAGRRCVCARRWAAEWHTIEIVDSPRVPLLTLTAGPLCGRRRLRWQEQPPLLPSPRRSLGHQDHGPPSPPLLPGSLWSCCWYSGSCAARKWWQVIIKNDDDGLGRRNRLGIDRSTNRPCVCVCAVSMNRAESVLVVAGVGLQLQTHFADGRETVHVRVASILWTVYVAQPLLNHDLPPHQSQTHRPTDLA